MPGISGEGPWGSSMGGHVNWGNLIRWGRTGGCCGIFSGKSVGTFVEIFNELGILGI